MIRRPPRPRPAPAGFTLIELMVALVLMAAVVTTVLRFLLNVDQSWETSRDQLNSRQHERAGADLLIRDIRMAGSGYGGVSLVTAGVPDNRLRSIEPRPGPGASDTLIVTGGFTGVGTISAQPMVTPADPIVVDSIAGFAVDDLVVVTNGVEANLFQVTAVNAGNSTLQHVGGALYNDPGGHVVWPLGGYPAASTVVVVERVRWWVSELDRADRLMRQPVGQEAVPISEGLTGLRLRYELAGGLVVADPPDTSLIRAVILSYMAPGPGADGMYDPDTLTVRVTPRVIG